MNEYNDLWTHEHFIEYRKLKKLGYSHEQLKEHFGENIWNSKIYNKNGNILPWLDFINEIKITPIENRYRFYIEESLFYKNEKDYYAEFKTDKNNYIICLMCYYINDIKTYNIIFSTKDQFDLYNTELNRLLNQNNYISEEDRTYLKSIFEKETKLNEIYDIMKRISYIIIDIHKNYLNNIPLSLSDTDNYRKISLYRDIIKSSFENIIEEETIDKYNNKYYIYKNNN